MKNEDVLWGGAFLLLVALSLDFWNWGASEPLYLGVPFWVVNTFILSILFSLYYLAFSKYHWGN